MPTTEPGLRERKKAATRLSLHEAALRLALEHGPDRITVEAIADDAGVSRRTFSNYFANKEEALFYGQHQRMREMAEMIRARPATEPAWQALTAAAAEFYSAQGDLDPEWTARTRLMRRHPSLAAAQMQTFAAMEREVAAEVAVRLGHSEDPSGVRATLMAATFLSALRVALSAWLLHPADSTYWEVASEALAEAGRGYTAR
ncbi:TetR family transcriptional regulator [Actinoplanes sp. OR16]|nr:TetR family transcriptional regulator [Actinoplanes sp. OR16]